jgi:hypothetical protein
MRIMTRLNNTIASKNASQARQRMSAMQKLILTACAIAFLGGLITGKSVLAQDNTNNVYWAGKPIQCGPTDYALNQAMEGDLKPLWAGYGWSNSVNYDEPLPVLIHLHMDPESQRWVVMETGAPGTETCIISSGEGATFSPDEIMDLITTLADQ